MFIINFCVVSDMLHFNLHLWHFRAIEI